MPTLFGLPVILSEFASKGEIKLADWSDYKGTIRVTTPKFEDGALNVTDKSWDILLELLDSKP